ncbi:hypothetical protein [Methylocucumis oryzae]|nr:hypothetical protein [Methylocucumis oryzae]
MIDTNTIAAAKFYGLIREFVATIQLGIPAQFITTLNPMKCAI